MRYEVETNKVVVVLLGQLINVRPFVLNIVSIYRYTSCALVKARV
jgi:hypothetical protein